MSVKIFGFGLLRNGIKYDYPFLESLESLTGLCSQTYLALGQSDDGTENAIKKIHGIKIIPTIWDEKLKQGGLILSQQTNVALDELRKDHGNDDEAWGIYLQCDEVLHENEYAQIVQDIQNAQDNGHDVVKFRYNHFWLRYDQVAISWKWYPQEIRAVKLKSKIESWGDAQSFRNYQKAYESDAHIYHYGHVRKEEAYKQKKIDILSLYHDKDERKKMKVLAKQERDQKSIPYHGPHPLVMKQRMGEWWFSKTIPDAYIVGDRNLFSEKFWQQFDVTNWHFSPSPSLFKGALKDKIVFLREPNLLEKVIYYSRVPKKMDSELARPWTNEDWATLKMSERGISFCRK